MISKMRTTIGHLRKLISESRPTPIDKGAISKLVDELYDALIAALRVQPAAEPIGDHKNLVEVPFSTRDVRGKYVLSFPVKIRSVTEEGHDGVFIGAGAGKVRGRTVIDIEINGKYSPERYAGDMAQHLKKALYVALIHEVTHVADLVYDLKGQESGQQYYKADNSIDPEKYYNDPREVRAYIQEAVDEALERAAQKPELRGKEMVKWAMAGRTVSMLEGDMNARNFARVARAIYNSLEKEGYFGNKEAPQAS